MMRRALSALVAPLALLLVGASPVPPAALADTQLADPAQEEQARTLMATLRCLVCQGQAIGDSDSDMAGDMRALVRQRIAAGESPDQVRDWLIARYGSYVSYDPPFAWSTAPLWFAPVLLIVLGLWVASRSFRRRRG